MREWKDKGQLPIKNKKLFAIGIFFTFLLAVIHYFAYGYLDIENIAGIALGAFLIYAIWFGGGYKIARYLAERKARQSDNDWRPEWKK